MNENKPGFINPIENKNPSLDEISKELGLVENSEILEIRKNFEFERGLDEKNLENLIKWVDAVQKLTEEITIGDTLECWKAQVGFNIALASLYKKFNDSGNYLITINEAMDLAHEFGMADTLSKLQKIK